MTAEKILLAHGSGGKISHELISEILCPMLSSPILSRLDDAALFEMHGTAAFTTDSFVVNPLFFPGGDIGRLAVCGTVNDLAVMGARPLYLSLGLIIEEGLPVSDLKRILKSLKQAADEAGVQIVTGDTKVVNHGSADKIFINTSGIGSVIPGLNLSGSNCRPGDKIIVSGTLGDHGIAVMTRRENLRFKTAVSSDCAPLNGLIAEILPLADALHCMRDPTRGGLATTLNEIAAQSAVSLKIREEALPVKESVRSACEMLGLDPLLVANEGKVVIFCAAAAADKVLAALRRHPYGQEAAIIGEVISGEHPGRVVLQTKLGASRIIEMLSGELLPRIC
jgi:hydrogenase expression/formation protein HypE